MAKRKKRDKPWRQSSFVDLHPSKWMEYSHRDPKTGKWYYTGTKQRKNPPALPVQRGGPYKRRKPSPKRRRSGK